MTFKSNGGPVFVSLAICDMTDSWHHTILNPRSRLMRPLGETGADLLHREYTQKIILALFICDLK